MPLADRFRSVPFALATRLLVLVLAEAAEGRAVLCDMVGGRLEA